MVEETAEEPMSGEERRRFLLLSSVMVVVAALFTAAFIYFTSSDSDDAIESSRTLTAEEREAGESLAEGFITAASTWGLRTEQVNADNLRRVAFTVQRNTQTADTYWYSRNSNYEALQEAYLAEDGDLWYGPSTVQGWWDPISREVLASFRAGEVTADMPEAASRLTVNGVEVDAVTVPVTYSVKQQKRMATATDSSWDGTYSVMERVYDDSAQVTLVKTAEGWRVHDLTGNRFPFLLTTWATPDEDYNADQHDFTEVDRVKVKLGNH